MSVDGTTHVNFHEEEVFAFRLPLLKIHGIFWGPRVHSWEGTLSCWGSEGEECAVSIAANFKATSTKEAVEGQRPAVPGLQFGPRTPAIATEVFAQFEGKRLGEECQTLTGSWAEAVFWNHREYAT